MASATTSIDELLGPLVKAAAVMLDSHEQGWAQRIDCARFRIGLGCDCILGQLHDQWSSVCEDEPFFTHRVAFNPFECADDADICDWLFDQFGELTRIQCSHICESSLDRLWLSEISTRLTP